MNALIALFFFLIPGVVWAEKEGPVGIGLMANNLMGPVTVASNFVGSISIVMGASFLFASLLKYLQHRVNPLAVPISTIVLLLIMGIVLVFLPLVYKLTEGGIPYSFGL